MSSGVKAKASLTIDNISSLKSEDPSKILDLTSSLSEITTPILSLVKSSFAKNDFKILPVDKIYDVVKNHINKFNFAKN